MDDLSGEFDINGQAFKWEVIEVHTFDGEEFSGDDIEDQLENADRVFYKAEDSKGEIFYRWLGGPFHHISEIEEAITDELDAYEEASAT